MKLRLRQLFTSLLLLPLILAAVVFTSPQKVNAVTGADWKPGRIIDDSIFFNKDAMSVSQIQAFLNAKVPVCAKNHANYSPTYPGPYTCLKDYQENTTTGESNVGRYNGDGTPFQVPGGKSSAQIIWDAAQAYNINPQTLIVMLQKEQSLVTDDWPLIVQYQKAMGQSCPDTAPCDPAFAGFYRQVSGAAWQIRHYINNPTWFNYRAGVTRFVLYNPNSSCGGTNVFIENNATAALYNYTPYQPNSGALSNLYGTAPCGAYGNRNFWRLFNDWFGSTLGASYDWTLVAQQLFTDSNKTTPASARLGFNSRVYAVITVRNSGNSTWNKSGTNPVRLGTGRPFERSSKLCDSTWLSCSRPASMTEDTVSPGGTATFEFWITPNFNSGSFKEYFLPVVEGVTWMRDIGLFYTFDVDTPTFTWQLTSQYAYTNELKTTPKNMASLTPGERVYVGFTARNTGNTTWKNSGLNSVKVGTISPYERQSRFSTGSDWLSGTRPALMQESETAPGGTATFEFWMTAPMVGGVFNERFGILMDGIRWMQDIGLSYYANVSSPIYSWQLTSQYAYTNELKTTPKNMASLTPGERVYVGFTARNTGNTTWKNSGANFISVGTLSPLERLSTFATGSNWLSPTRPATMAVSQPTVAPGETATFEFWMTAPATAGVLNERFGLVINGVAWLNDTGLSYYTNVNQ